MEVYSQTGEFDDDIFYVDTLAHNMKKSIGVLVYKNNDECVIFDSGMPNCANQILRSLKSLKIEQESICYILLTHRHIDHAGASYDLLKNFSQAKVGIRSFSIRHLSDPSKIYQSGKELFREFASPMKPIQLSSMIALEDNQEIRVGHDVIKAIYSPGHTSDHISFYIPSKKTLYCGDVIGSFNPEMEKIHPTSIYPSFNYEKYKETIDGIRIIRIPYLNKGLILKLLSLTIIIPFYFISILKNDIIIIYGNKIIAYQIIIMLGFFLKKK